MSTIVADNLTGKTTAGSVTVTSEGGAATQSLQQGLAKVWVNINGSSGTPTAVEQLKHLKFNRQFHRQIWACFN